jgi:pimeloyl-ACP methyl ester carboxylesterase
MPTTIVAGARDSKFSAVGKRMAELVPRAEFVAVLGGHTLLLERPERLASVMAS